MSEAILEAELVAACSSLGYSDGDKYIRDPECVEIIRDLLRYLRRDDSSHQIRLALGETRVLQTDLLPLLREHHSDGVLLDLVLRLLVNLTTPALLVFHQEIPEDKSGRQMYLRLVTQQQGFKEAFTDAGVWAGISEILRTRLEQGADRDDDANLVVEMALVLLRNVLAVAPGRHDTTRTADDADLHDQTRKHYNARHSRFGGTFCIQNMKSISDRDVIAHKPLADVCALDFDQNKRGKKIPKNRAPLPDSSTTRRSTLAIRLFLQEFCVEFLNGAYNNLMSIVKDNLNRARVQEHDESYYLWAMKFFMEFNRHHEFKVELVSETLSIQSVHYIQTNIETYHEMMTTEKKKIPLWSRRMHNGLRAYQETMMTLASMDKSNDQSVRDSSLALKSKMFYVVEYRELPLVLLLNYDPSKMSRAYLKDLVETTHVFLKLLEGMCKKTKHLLVQLPQRKKSSHKRKPEKKAGLPPTPEKLEEIWSSLADELSSVIRGEAGELPVMVPFDAVSELSEDEQKEKAMRKTNALLRDRELGKAVALFRASREVWPEGDVFGEKDIDAAGELACLREVFMADLNPTPQTETPEVPEEEVEDDDDDEEEREEVHAVEESAHMSERELDFPAFVRRFAHPKILQSYTWLFKSYSSNSDHTNRCIIKLFHRIAWDAKLPAVLFQASIFVILHEAMTDPARKTSEIISEIAKLGKYIVRQFFTIAETNPKVFMEILFWKTYKEAVDIECGYDGPSTSKAVKSLWSEEEEDELTRLYNEFKDNEYDADDPKDIADRIVQSLIRQDRSRRMVIKKLKDMGLIASLKELRKKPTRVMANQWTDVELDELKVLYEEHKDAMDPMSRILDFMVNRKPKHRVIEKLLELGLIDDKKEVRRKRIPKAKQNKSRGKNSGEQFLKANRDSDDGADSEVVDDSDGSSSEDDEQELTGTVRSKSTNAVPVVTPHLVSVALKKVFDSGYREAVSWLVELLQEVADDRESDGDFSPIPILAVSDEQSKAIDDDCFQSLLKIIGIQPPQNHEEMFWRVPEKLSVEGLRKRVQYLSQGLEGKLPSPTDRDEGDSSVTESFRNNEVLETPLESSCPEQTEDGSDVNEEKENRGNSPLIGHDSNSELNSDSSLVSPHLKSKKITKRRQKLDSDTFNDLVSKAAPKNVKKRRILMEQSDNEDDDNLYTSDRNKSPKTSEKRSQVESDTFDALLNSQHKAGASKKRRILIDQTDDEASNDSQESSTSAAVGAHDAVDDSQNSRKRARILDSDDDEASDDYTKMRKLEPTRGVNETDQDSDDDQVPIVRHRTKAVIDSDDEN
ncbi:hypothetical protein HAZT_HAZT005746 [Hyalella azteca]|uniref:Timeless N-terminal domain-containing protein n=1 Tax=Hyalella azteca TaxID=294128 RepID=A0A6A0H601_HYAAZ|nr:hypothetical protein HAZT_HAZT005746 [Hyalella azteca]